ncbi:UspA domain-containing protein [Halovivax asiaticus JCM 14624]|uniref:UspA domain-containing protein n=1 Tax=Halovivax asiaticus JCM 14624 TaxID=1227490 RepID=M0BNR4_9EURY|nr:universal stress protein [Halovivax asiaticus]ELZ12511.1 UspA domain-containing protein [Halovivax asiaticus JCM 14624]
MFDRIVLAVDGSDEARHAAARGLDLAEAFGAAVDALFVVDESALRLTRSSSERERLRARGQEVLADVEALAAERDRSITTAVVEGAPATAIGEYATENAADAIVVGRQGMTGLGKRLLGGVTERLLRGCDVPVFVVPADDDLTPAEEDYQTVLVPTDGSDPAAAAADYGSAIAGRTGAALHVLNVVDVQAAGGLFSAGGLESEFLERLEARGHEIVDDAVADLDAEQSTLDVTTAVERISSHQGVAPGIREYAEENAVDLVVMGSRGRSTVGRQLLGSAASTVLRTVSVPVLVVSRAP